MISMRILMMKFGIACMPTAFDTSRNASNQVDRVGCSFEVLKSIGGYSAIWLKFEPAWQKLDPRCSMQKSLCQWGATLPFPIGKLKIAVGFGPALILLLPTQSVFATTPLHDPVSLNIGFNCRWEARCMKLQRNAMKRALEYVAKRRPTPAKIHRCNRSAARAGARVDWIGFNHCIRNPATGR
jgi:hypothetical protein